MKMPELLIATNPDNPVIVGSILPGDAQAKAKQIPTPSTFHLLCLVPETEDTYENGIAKAAQTQHFEEVMTPVLFVVKMGPDAYKDEKRFPTGPACKEGDFVLVRPNTGTRLKIHGREFRIIMDDSVQAVVEDPRGLTRA